MTSTPPPAGQFGKLAQVSQVPSWQQLKDENETKAVEQDLQLQGRYHRVKSRYPGLTSS